MRCALTQLPLPQLPACTIQIYWVGPISGAIVAGFFYEFIFNPTRKLSLCYRPKLFRFSAQDMARVGSKSRVYQQQQKFTNQPTTTLFRPQSYHQTMNHSPSTRSTSNNLITSPTLLNLTRDPQSITTSTSVAHLQSSFPISNTFDQISYLQQQQQHQPLHNHQPNLSANFDRCKSTAIINTISGNNANLQPHQSTINLPSNRNNNLDLGKFMSNNTSGLDHQQNHMDFLFVNNSKPTYSEL